MARVERGAAMRRAVIAVVLTVAGAAPLDGAVTAQDRQVVAPGPRFLADVAGAKPVGVALNRTPILSQMVTLELDNESLEEALDQITRQTGIAFVYSLDDLPELPRITLMARRISVAGALRAILASGDVDVLVKPRRQMVLMTRDVDRPPALSIIAGRVTDSTSGEPLGSATVTVEGTRLNAVTGSDGRFRIDAVPAGPQVVVVRRIGYGQVRRPVTVVEGQETVVDVALGAVATPLEEMVVTGTAFETQMRTVPNPISVVTAREIEEKGSTSITELLRGEIPGVVAPDLGLNDYGGGYYVRGNASWATGDVLKIYIDGVHVSDPTFLSTIDPKSIDRIEIVRGPQAAAIYGAEAASGVMQVFTKKGQAGARPRVDVQASFGAMESRYKPADAGLTMNQDHSVGVSGGGPSYSYRLGASYLSVGEWLPRYGSKTLGLSGGLKVTQGPFTADLTLLWSQRDLDPAVSPVYRQYPKSLACLYCGQPELRYPNYEYGLSQHTMGITLGYRATDRWQHTLTLGEDQNGFAWDQPAPHLLAPADTFVMLSNRESRRRSIRYHTALDTRLGRAVTARFTAGVDYWSYDIDATSSQRLRNVSGVIQTTPLTTTMFTNDSWWNAGYLGMTEIGFSERLYLTLAARVEDNPHFGEAYGTAFSPRLGAAYSFGLGGATALKLRAQWGKGVRPPPAVARTGGAEQTGGLGLPAAVYLPNPDIGPEERVGWDGGIDLYFGSTAFVSVTRYEEEGRNLVQYVSVDPAAIPETRQYRNIGKVKSAGWELEGQLQLGPVTLNANYAYADNSIVALGDQYASDPNSIYKVGDRMEFIPKHSAGATATLRFLRGTVSLNTSVADEWRALDNLAFFGFLYGGEPFRGNLRAYFTTYSDALWKWNVRAQQEVLRDRLTLFVRLNNLGNSQRADLFNGIVAPGRTTMLGARWTY